MNAKFHCPRCNAAVEADSAQAGMTGDCPACGAPVVIPTQAIPVPRVVRKDAQDYAADAVIGVAKIGWKTAKVAAQVAVKVAIRAVDAVTPAVKDIAAAPCKRPSGGVVYAFIRALFR